MDAKALVLRLQECFNTRQFAGLAEVLAPDFYSHPLQATGVEAGTRAWNLLTARYPEVRVVAEDILVDGDRAAVRSSVHGIPGAHPELFEIFRVADGGLAEMWGAFSDFPAAPTPAELT